MVAAPLLLAACSTNNTYMPPRTGYIEPPQRVTASLTSLNYRIELGRGQTALTRAQVDGLNRFLASNGETDGDHIEIRTAAMAGPGRNAAIADTLRGSFLAGGYTPSRVQIVDTPGYGDVVEVTIQRYTVQLPDCSHDIQREEGLMAWSDEPTNLRRLGCSNETDLGLMIADPRDLHGGRPTGDAAGYREAEALKRYRTDEVKELKDVSTKSTGSSGSSK
jgi:pilus assembly protein CpaD